MLLVISVMELRLVDLVSNIFKGKMIEVEVQAQNLV